MGPHRWRAAGQFWSWAGLWAGLLVAPLASAQLSTQASHLGLTTAPARWDAGGLQVESCSAAGAHDFTPNPWLTQTVDPATRWSLGVDIAALAELGHFAGLGLRVARAEAEADAEDAALSLPPAPTNTAELGRGLVSWYGPGLHGRKTASGERFDMYTLTAAHPTLPFGTQIRVRHEASGREVVVRINDRGPHVRGRVIDLSRKAAEVLGVLGGSQTVVLLAPEHGDGKPPRLP
jgi:rare lipoprotein A